MRRNIVIGSPPLIGPAVGFTLRTSRTKRRTPAAGFLDLLSVKAPFVIRTVLTDNGQELTDRFCATIEQLSCCTASK